MITSESSYFANLFALLRIKMQFYVAYSNVNSVDNDCLRVDVWDFNPEEKVGDKFRKINEIKDSRGLRKFIKETLNATTGTIQHDLIGSVEIPLNVSNTSH